MFSKKRRLYSVMCFLFYIPLEKIILEITVCEIQKNGIFSIITEVNGLQIYCTHAVLMWADLYQQLVHILRCYGLYIYIYINDLYSSPNIVRVIKSRRMRWAGHVALMGEERGVYRVLVGKPEGKRPLGRPRRRWVDNIRMDLQEVRCVYMDWIGLAQDRNRWRTLVSAVMNLLIL
jgi:hypothetical protein